MQKKDTYTLEELYDNLRISLSKLSKMADINEGTLIRIRKGRYSVRRTTINKLFDAFSEIYGIRFSLDNVTGFTLENKKPSRSQSEESHTATDEQVPTPSISTSTPRISTSQETSPQKRAYTTAEDIPTDWVLCSDFFEGLEIKETTYRRWLKDGLGGEKLEFEERPRPGKADKFRYFTPTQQEQALEILKRHGKVKTAELST